MTYVIYNFRLKGFCEYAGMDVFNFASGLLKADKFQNEDEARQVIALLYRSGRRFGSLVYPNDLIVLSLSEAEAFIARQT